MNRDTFQRHQNPLAKTKPLSEDAGKPALATDEIKQSGMLDPLTGTMVESPGSNRLGTGRPGTAPARPDTRQLGARMSPAALRTLVEQTLAKAHPLASGLEPRVELLLHAFKTLDKPIPGVTIGEFKHELTPNTQKIVAYLVRVLQIKPDLHRKMAVAVFRFQEAATVLERTRMALELDELPPNALEELKLKFFYLTNYHEEFKGDPILTQLFPPPKNAPMRRALSGNITGGTAMLQKQQQQARQSTLTQAEALWRGLAPRAEIMKLALSMMDVSTARRLGAMFKPNERAAANVAKAVKGDDKALAQLKRGVELVSQFQELYVQVKNGADVEPLMALIASINQLASGWAIHPVLKTVLTPKDLAPTKELSGQPQPDS